MKKLDVPTNENGSVIVREKDRSCNKWKNKNNRPPLHESPKRQKPHRGENRRKRKKVI
jgi:hypothetical protein